LFPESSNHAPPKPSLVLFVWNLKQGPRQSRSLFVTDGEVEVESMKREVKQVLRKLARSPGFTTIAVLTLALGIGANSAIFTVVNSVLIQPLPFPEQDRLLAVNYTAPGMDVELVPHSQSTYLITTQENQVFESFGVYNNTDLNLTGDQEPERVPAVIVSQEILPLLGAVPQVGRLTNLDDHLTGAPEVVVLSHQLWQRRYSGDPSIVGRTIQVNDAARQVVGVTREGFDFLFEEAEMFVPAHFDPAAPDEGSFNMPGIGRLKVDVTIVAAEVDVARMISLMPERFSGGISQALLDQIGFAPNLLPLKNQITGEVSRTLWILLAAVGLLFLIACSNVANLFLVRAEGRQREVAVRTAMGASGRDLARHFLTESVALGALGGFVGLLLAWAGTRGLVAFGPESLPRLAEIGVDIPVLLFTLAVSLLSGFLFGLFPVWKYRKPDMAGGLKEGGRGGSVGRERHRARNTLVVSQMALALVLLVGSGLMLRSFQALRSVDPGFDPEQVLTLRITLPEATYTDADSRIAFHDQLQDRIARMAGVVSVGAGSDVPLGGGMNRSGTVFEDFPLMTDEMPEVIETNRITAGYMETLGMRLMEGRLLTPFDARDRSGAVVVTRELAQHYFPGQSAIGKRLSQNISLREEGGAGEETEWQTIVGVVEDVRTQAMNEDPVPLLYFPLVEASHEEDDRGPQTLAYVVKASLEPTALLPAIRETLRSQDPNLPIADIMTMDSVVRDSMARTSFAMVLLGIAAVVALLLGTVGIYGVISYVVTQRTCEMGIRLALGAKESVVASMVLKQGAYLAGMGIGLGLAGAFALTRLMEAMLFGVSATDPTTFILVPMTLGGVALLASYIPARRASRIDPVEALRAE
jgi:putative ABC transport system permease protein